MTGIPINQVLEQEQRAACGVKAGRGVRRVLAARAGEVPGEQDPANCRGV